MNETRIEAARAAVAAVQSEIDSLNSQLGELRRELVGLSGDGLDPAELTRRHALLEAVENVRARLPKQTWRRGESLPLLQIRLQKAEDELERVRSERFRLAETIAEVEAESELWGAGVPAAVEAALALVASNCRRVGEYPPNLNERSLSGLVFWSKSVRERIESLPALRARLAEYGPDPDYEPGGGWAEFERAWPSYRARLQKNVRLPG
jgi:hypothetical protein